LPVIEQEQLSDEMFKLLSYSEFTFLALTAKCLARNRKSMWEQ